ncbi:MAG: FHA domain-containing protein [Deltaproteobacteria bacterium]|nr:MAG: FHA domain-containing protein [Deltaproteobacteria bacterium]
MHPQSARDDGAGMVVLKTVDGTEHTLFHGDIIGRLWSAALHLNDGRVSEAHAMVSNRGRELKLLSLRGKFRVDGEVLRDVVLAEGQTIELAPGVAIEVVEVLPPTELLALRAPGLGARIIAGVVSLTGGDQPAIQPGWRPGTCQVWPTGDGWMRAHPEGPVLVTDGATWEVEGARFSASFVEHGAVRPTEDGGQRARLRVVAHYDTVHVHNLSQGTVLVVSGRPARLISELVIIGQPVDWHTLALELWGGADRDVLRRRWDMMLSRLRRKLRTGGIRSDLVFADGTGLVQLVLGAQDEVVDET